MKKGFVEETTFKKNKAYSVTDKGVNYLEEYNTIINFTSSFGLE